MEIHELPFARIMIIRDDIAEVIIHEGVEMDPAMVAQYHAFLLTHLKAPFSLLINKVNAYSYTPQAQPELATLKEIRAMAVVPYTRMSVFSTKTLSAFPRDDPWNLRIFPNREEALVWLIAEQDSQAR